MERAQISAGFTAHAQRGAGQDGELGAGVEAVNVFGGIGFGETELLRFFQRVGKRNSGAFDSGQDVIAGAVENAAELDEFVSGEAFLKAGDDGDASGNRSSECDVSVVLAGQADEIGALPGDELFVGGDHRLAGLQRAAHPVAGGIDAADEFDDDVGIGRENVLRNLPSSGRFARPNPPACASLRDCRCG